MFQEEQRTSLRFAATGRLTASVGSSGDPVAVRDVGLGGFAVESPEPIPAGLHKVRLTARGETSPGLEGRRVYCQAAPARGAARFTAGFEFVRAMETADREVKVLIQNITGLRFALDEPEASCFRKNRGRRSAPRRRGD
jgi:hypothetical protein